MVLFTKIAPTLKTDFSLDIKDFLEFFEARKSHASGAYESTIKSVFSICSKVTIFFDHSDLSSKVVSVLSNRFLKEIPAIAE